MANIQQLDPHVADLIAAGEVVDRPANVVKELMENSIDAGASSLTVETRQGGMNLIRVSDNGSGIAAEDAEIAFLRHATSKVRTKFDLDAITTLGFRGEALAAIASVAQVELHTRTADEELGTSLLLEGGKLRSREPNAHPVGTTILVRNLFFNTPARRKFVKRDTAENAASLTVAQRIALAHPEVAVSLFRDERQVFATPGDGNLYSAIYTVLGRKILSDCLPCKGSGENGISLSGYISRPLACRGSRSGQFFFLNGRFVKNATMTAALEEAFKNRSMVGKYPACILHLTVKPNTVDVNVHPAKIEVKFADERQIFHAIYYAVKFALDQESLLDAFPNQSQPKSVQKEPPRPKSPQPPSTSSAPVTNPNPSQQPSHPSGDLPLNDSQPLPDPPPPPTPENSPAPTDDFDDLNLPVLQELPARSRLSAKRQPSAPDVPAPEPSAPPPPQDAPEPPSQNVDPPPPEVAPLLPQSPAWQIRGEILDTYLIVERGSDIFLIDKHAAHERMNFDRMRSADYHPLCQRLASPSVTILSPDECSALLSNLDCLQSLGFEIEDFGGSTVAVRQIPHYITLQQLNSTLSELAAQIIAAGSADASVIRDNVLRSMACRAAVKGGWKSGPEELQIIAEAVMSGQVKYCPHGRPIVAKLTRHQLERMFKRT